METTSNGQDGLEVLRTESANGILLGLEMPVMDGLTMLKQLRHKLGPFR